MTTEALEADVLLARDGDEAAFRRVVERCANSVCSIALSIVRSIEASEDIAQEVFLAAWSGLKNLQNPASFLPWLRQIARNQSYSWRRRHDHEVSDEAILAAAADARPSAVERMLATEKTRVIREVLDELPEDAREILVLYYREGSSAKQVGLLLGISEQAVRQRLSRSRATLREEVLRHFAEVVTASAPGTAFASMVAGAVALTTQSVSAAGVGAATAAGGVSVVGGVFGWAGVLMGMRTLEPAFDEREGRELRWFRSVVLLVVTIGGIAVAINSVSALRLLIAVQSLYVAVGALYAVWLPKILSRRYAAMRERNRELADQSRRRWFVAVAGRAAGLAIAGTIVMAVMVSF